jgi:hypothetical protein
MMLMKEEKIWPHKKYKDKNAQYIAALSVGLHLLATGI